MNDREQRVHDLHTALDGALSVYGALVRVMIENADRSGDDQDEWTLPRFTLRGGAGTFTVEPAGDLSELELEALVDACKPKNAPAGCRVNARWRSFGDSAGVFGRLTLEVWAR